MWATLGLGSPAQDRTSPSRPGVKSHPPLIYWMRAWWLADSRGNTECESHTGRLAALLGVEQRCGVSVVEGVRRARSLRLFPPHHTLDDVVTYEFDWGRVRTRVRYERSVEYWTELLTFDLSSDRMTGEKARDVFASNGEPPAHSNLFDSMAEICTNIKLHTGDDNESLVNISRHLHSDLDNFLTFCMAQQLARPADPACNQALFADLRGLVFEEAPAPAPRLFRRKNAGPTLFRPWWRAPDSGRAPGARAAIGAPETLSADDCQKRVVAFRPLVAASIEGLSAENIELAVSLMFQRRALHVSALGGAQPWSGDRSDRPIFSCFLVRGVSSWGTARLVETMCRLGLMRLGALGQDGARRRAGEHLRVVEGELVAAFGYDGTADRVESLAKVQNLIGKADAEILADGGAAGVEGGVGYRIQRANHYIAEYERLASGLNIENVEDYLSYVGFIEARLGESFGIIRNMGAQYDRLRRDERTLIELTRNERLIEIQMLADLALFLVLLPYYLGSILSHAVPWVGHCHEAPHTMWIAVLTSCASGWAFRYERPPSHAEKRVPNEAIKEEPKRRLQDILILVVAYMFLFVTVTLWVVVGANQMTERWQYWLGARGSSLFALGRLLLAGLIVVCLGISLGWPLKLWSYLHLRSKQDCRICKLKGWLLGPMAIAFAAMAGATAIWDKPPPGPVFVTPSNEADASCEAKGGVAAPVLPASAREPRRVPAPHQPLPGKLAPIAPSGAGRATAASAG